MGKGQKIVKTGMKKLLQLCNSGLSLGDVTEYYGDETKFPRRKQFIVGGGTILCEAKRQDEFEGVMAVFTEVQRFVTVVKTTKR